MFSCQHHESLMASHLLTRPKNSYSFSTLKSLAASQSVKACSVCFGGAERVGLKTKEKETVSSFSSLPHFFTFLSVWMVFFWTPQKFQCCSLCSRWRGVQMRCMAGWYYAAEIFEECLLKQPFVEIEGKVSESLPAHHASKVCKSPPAFRCL